MAEQRLTLPAPGRAGWVVMLAVGIGLLGFACVSLARHVGVLDSEPLHLRFFALGAGLFLCGFPLLVLGNRELASELVLNAEAGALRMTCSDGSAVVMPLGMLAGVRSYAAQGGDTARTISLTKRDGGVLEIGVAPSDEVAAELVDPLSAAIDAATARTAPDADPEERLTEIADISAVRAQDGTLSLSWKARGRLSALAMAGPLAGMLIIAYGFHRYQGSFGTLVAMAFTGTLLSAFLIFTLINVGVVQRVVIDAAALSLERMRFGKVIKRNQLRLETIETVDYTHQQSTIGAGLTIRTFKGQQRKAQADKHMATAAQHGDRDEDLAAGVHAAQGIAHLLNAGIQLPCGPLSLTAKIALDLTISEEIARRTVRSAGSI